MRKPKLSYYVGDFETTVYDDQTETEVWASAIVEMYTEDVIILHSIDETFDYLCNLQRNLIIYYHNLKFDGTFWLYYLTYVKKLKQGFIMDEDKIVAQKTDEQLEDGEFSYIISNMGQWYGISIKINGYIINIRDSLKLLPVSVKRLGESFGTKHKKTSIEYTGYRYAGCEITEEEKKYIANDVLVVKEALEIMFDQKHKSLTIGACCMKEFKQIMRTQMSAIDYKLMFPDLTKIELDKELYGSKDADEYIRESYKGGWCYLVKGKEGKIYKNGITADVNSLYPSMMHSESGNRYPIGYPTFWKGANIPEQITDDEYYYFIRIKCRFKIKRNMLPTIQIKHNIFYSPNEWLTTSDFYSKKDKKYYRYLTDMEGNSIEAKPILTLTKTDYLLFRKHYNVYDLEILDGCYFSTVIGLFDEYIDKYKQIKMNSKGALREIAKLFLNNLYGKLATNRIDSFKIINDEIADHLSFFTVTRDDKPVVYIPAGSAITSYARRFTITAAQANYHGINNRGFIYADTDSIHCDLSPDMLVNVPVHSSDFCHWKLEGSWDKAIFIRQKTYIEHIVAENLEPIDEPYHNIKCAGMPDACKQQLNYSFQQHDEAYWSAKLGEKWQTYTQEERDFICTPRNYSDFKVGLKIFGKLLPVQIKGGTVLYETTYEIR